MDMLNRSTKKISVVWSLVYIWHNQYSEGRQTMGELDMGYGTIHRILIDELNMSRVSAHWVPRLLKNQEMERWVMDSKTLLRCATHRCTWQQ